MHQVVNRKEIESWQASVWLSSAEQLVGLDYQTFDYRADYLVPRHENAWFFREFLVLIEQIDVHAPVPGIHDPILPDTMALI